MMYHMMRMQGKAELVFAQQEFTELGDKLELPVLPSPAKLGKSMHEMTVPLTMELIPDKIDYPQDMSERQARRKIARKLTSPVKAKYRGKTNPFKK
jgi:hypothetical protein